ncbi:MAG: hypothetical protein ACSHX0_06085 [Akkermansiaceae bacterium]
MLRKVTASVLLLLMTMVVATSQPGLHYCLCLKTIFFNSCECVDLIETGDCSQIKGTDELSFPCHTSNDREEAFKISLDNCSLDLVLNLDDFIESNFDGVVKGKVGVDSPIPLLFVEEANFIPSLRSRIHGIRGSPPHLVESSSVPLRVRYSVFLV